MVEDLKDAVREEPAYVLSERQMLEAWLDFHRQTLLTKCSGLTEEQLRQPRRPATRAHRRRDRHVTRCGRGCPGWDVENPRTASSPE